MSEANGGRTAGGAFIHEPPDSPTPQPAGSLAEWVRRTLGLTPEVSDPKQGRGLSKQLRFLLEMLRMRAGK
jgi:hypothetical protein